MAQIFDNPYQPATAIGDGLRNIAIGFFGGQKNAARNQSQIDLNAAHAALYNAQLADKQAETKARDRALQLTSEDAIDELVGAHAGLPVHSVRGYRRALQTGANLEEYAPYAEKINQAMLALRPAYAGGKPNPKQIADALFQQGKTADVRRVISGDQDSGVTTNAYYSVSGKPRYDNLGDVGTFDLTTGVQALNPLGTAKVATEGAHKGAYEGQRANSLASAGEHGARTAQIKDETKTGVKVGVPQAVVDPADPTRTIFVAPRDALNKQAGAKPSAAGGAGTETIVTAPTKPTELKKDAAGFIQATVASALGHKNYASLANDEKLSSVGAQIMARAEDYYTLPGSPAQGNQARAAELALKDVIGGRENFDSATFGSGGNLKKPPVDQLPPVGMRPGATTEKVTKKTRAGAPAAPAAPAAAPAPTAPAATQGGVPRPAGMSDKQLIDAANAAVTSGKKSEADVIRQLEAWGIKIQKGAAK